MAVMQLVDRKLLKLDNPVNLHLGKHQLKDMSSQGKPITIRHLLSHFSGLKNQTSLLPVWKRELPKPLEELVAEMQFEFGPGIRYQYSNSGYALAGLVVQKVSGKSYEQYLVDHLLKPIGSANNGPINPTATVLEQRAFPYRLKNGRAEPVEPQRFDIYPAGDAYISVPDMAKLLSVHLNNGMFEKQRILSDQSVKEMRTPQFSGKDGLDFGIVEADDERFIMHGGQVPGWNTKFILATKSKTGVYIATNSSEGLLPIDILAQMSVDLLRGKKVGTGLVKRVVHLGISFRKDKQTQFLRAQAIFPISSASQAGINKDTLIREINGVAVKELSMSKCLQLMEGGLGMKIKLEILEPGNTQSRTITLTKQAFLAPG